MVNSLKNVYEKLTHIHKVLYTWWCWHICKEEEVGELKEVFFTAKQLPDAEFEVTGLRVPASGQL